MPEWILFVAVLVCPLIMGAMMLLMWRGMRGSHAASRDRAED